MQFLVSLFMLLIVSPGSASAQTATQTQPKEKPSSIDYSTKNAMDLYFKNKRATESKGMNSSGDPQRQTQKEPAAGNSRPTTGGKAPLHTNGSPSGKPGTPSFSKSFSQEEMDKFFNNPPANVPPLTKENVRNAFRERAIQHRLQQKRNGKIPKQQ